MPWAAAAAAAAALIGGKMQSDASDRAAGAQTAASKEAIAAQQKQYATTRADSERYREIGGSAVGALGNQLGLPGAQSAAAKQWAKDVYLPKIRQHMQELADQSKKILDPEERVAAGLPAAGVQPLDPAWMPDEATLTQWSQFAPDEIKNTDTGTFGELNRKFSASDLQADPVYNSGLKFGLDRGTEAINSRATANGMYDSGATLKALTQFGTDYGSTKANESYNRFTNDQTNRYNRLAGVSGTGQIANSQVASSGMNMANSVGASLEGAGNARAAGIVGGANAWGNAAGNVNSAYNNQQSNARLDALLGRSGYGSSPYSSGPSQPYYTGYNSGGEYQYG